MLKISSFENSTYVRRNKQNGVTIIEVMVALFVLALGILALVGMQLRNLGSIKQAENIEKVSQAAENLAEGMMINPHLTLQLTPRGYVTHKDFSAYESLQSCANQEDGAKFINIDRERGHDTLAAEQIQQFCREINQIGSIAPEDIQVKVCAHSTLEGQLAWDFSCKKGGQQTVVKLVWKYQTRTARDKDTPDNTTDPAHVMDDKNKVVLSYEVPLTE